MLPKNVALILFFPRTGSSLLAQTLRLLGKPVLGEAESNSPVWANPRGYYDIPEIRDRGFVLDNLEKYASRLDGHAIKVLIRSTLIDNASQWEWIARICPRIFVTYRNPLEQVLSSNAVFKQKTEGTVEHFVEVTQGLLDWTRQIGSLISLVNTHYPQLRSNIQFIGYHEHLDNRCRYVSKIAQHAGLDPTDAQRHEAVSNIEDSLYRFRMERFHEKYIQWYRKTPAKKYFECLVNDSQKAWELTWRV